MKLNFKLDQRVSYPGRRCPARATDLRVDLWTAMHPLGLQFGNVYQYLAGPRVGGLRDLLQRIQPDH